MVSFTCNGCNDTLKKNQVDAHAGRCRRCESVSCIDCHVSFFGDDYRAHTSCITEVEKHEKRTPASKKNGKVPPQQQWMDLLTSAVDSAPSHLQQHLRSMVTLDNVPRKEKQFRNFTANSCNLKGANGNAIVSEIWNFLNELREKQKEDFKKGKEENAATATPAKKQDEKNGSKETPEKDSAKGNETKNDNSNGSAKKEKKQKEATPKKQKKVNKRTVKKAMKLTLKKQKDNCMTLKDLRKAVEQRLGVDKSAKDAVKNSIKENCEDASQTSFVVDGKIVNLKVKS